MKRFFQALKDHQNKLLCGTLVLGVHLYLALHGAHVPTPLSKPLKKPLIVKTVSLPPLIVEAPKVETPKTKKTPAPKKLVKQASPEKKALKKEKPLPKKNPAQKKLLADLETALDKATSFSQPETKSNDLSLPSPTLPLQIDLEETDMTLDDLSALSLYLQQMLTLPEYGTVKLKLLFNENGQVIEMSILSSESKNNADYLLKQVPHLNFSTILKSLSKKNGSAIILNFCNEK